MGKRVKAKAIRKMVSNGKLDVMFAQMTGAENADKNIILPKFLKTRASAVIVYKTLKQLANFATFRNDFPEMVKELDEILNYAEHIKKCIIFDDDKTETAEHYVTYSTEQLNAIYKGLKSNKGIEQLVILCGKLSRFKPYIGLKDNLSGHFVMSEPGNSLCIFPFSSLDLVKVWTHNNCTPLIKKYILHILHVVYSNTHIIYDQISSPDIDINEFSKVLIDAVKFMKTQVPRCNEAFKKIEDSIDLLKTNFRGYFKESVETANPSVILENFVSDVARKGGPSARITAQFNKIVRHLKNTARQNNKKDPNIKKLFGMLNSNFQLMEKSVAPEKYDQALKDVESSSDSDEVLNEEKKNKSFSEHVRVYNPKPDAAVRKIRNRKKKKKRK